MIFLKTKPAIFVIGVALLTLGACSKDSGGGGGGGGGTTSTTDASANLNGTYSGALRYIETNLLSGNKDTTENPSIDFVIAGTKPNYTLTSPSVSGDLSIVSNNNTFTSSDATGDFAGSTYTGTLSGDVITINWSGSDSSDSWVGSFTGSRPATGGGGSGGGGGGSGCNNMSISGYTVGGPDTAAACLVDFQAAFQSDQSGYYWHLLVSFYDDCDAGVSDGTYTLLTENNASNSMSAANIELDLEHDGNNPDLIQLITQDNSGSISVTNTASGLKIVASNITMYDSNNPGVSKTVSFCVE